MGIDMTEKCNKKLGKFGYSYEVKKPQQLINKDK